MKRITIGDVLAGLALVVIILSLCFLAGCSGAPTSPGAPPDGGGGGGGAPIWSAVATLKGLTTWPMPDPQAGPSYTGTGTARDSLGRTVAITSTVRIGQLWPDAVLVGNVTGPSGVYQLIVWGPDATDGSARRIACGQDTNTRWDRLEVSADGRQIRIVVTGGTSCGVTEALWTRIGG